jgi:hypothetical protein
MKAFFFEKKKQKTFVLMALAHDETGFSSFKTQKFFGSFFQKRTACLFC